MSNHGEDGERTAKESYGKKSFPSLCGCLVGVVPLSAAGRAAGAASPSSRFSELLIVGFSEPVWSGHLRSLGARPYEVVLAPKRSHLSGFSILISFLSIAY